MSQMIIIGSGISGALASRYFHCNNVFDQASAPCLNHQAVMRIRDPRVGMLLGSGMEKVLVKKGVFHRGHVLDHTTIAINNLYSLKVSGSLSPKSVLYLEDAERFLLSSYSLPPVIWDHKLEKIADHKAIFKTKNGLESFDYGVCISTIPLPIMAKAIGVDFGVDFNCQSIFVIRVNLSVSSTVHQTIYFPDHEFKTYRATIEGDVLIIESMVDYPSEIELSTILTAFGISFSHLTDREERHVQRMGKLVDIDEDTRKAILYELTERFNIYSLGRFAIWKQIRTDDVVKDLEVIKRLIYWEAKRGKYESKIDKLYG